MTYTTVADADEASSWLGDGPPPPPEGAVDRDAELDAALLAVGGWRSPYALRAVAVGCAQWLLGSMAALIVVFTHDVARKGGGTAANEFDLVRVLPVPYTTPTD